MAANHAVAHKHTKLTCGLVVNLADGGSFLDGVAALCAYAQLRHLRQPGAHWKRREEKGGREDGM